MLQHPRSASTSRKDASTATHAEAWSIFVGEQRIRHRIGLTVVQRNGGWHVVSQD